MPTTTNRTLFLPSRVPLLGDDHCGLGNRVGDVVTRWGQDERIWSYMDERADAGVLLTEEEAAEELAREDAGPRPASWVRPLEPRPVESPTLVLVRWTPRQAAVAPRRAPRRTMASRAPRLARRRRAMSARAPDDDGGGEPEPGSAAGKGAL